MNEWVKDGLWFQPSPSLTGVQAELQHQQQGQPSPKATQRALCAGGALDAPAHAAGRLQLQSQQPRPIGPSPTSLTPQDRLTLSSSFTLGAWDRAGVDILLLGKCCKCGCVCGVLTEAGGPKGGVRKTARRQDGERRRGHWLEHGQKQVSFLIPN